MVVPCGMFCSQKWSKSCLMWFEECFLVFHSRGMAYENAINGIDIANIVEARAYADAVYDVPSRILQKSVGEIAGFIAFT